jgi:hypothetical protein
MSVRKPIIIVLYINSSIYRYIYIPLVLDTIIIATTPKTPDFSRAETILNIPKRNSIISRLIASKADSTLITCKSTINSAPIVIDVHMGMLPSCLLCMINT